VVYGGGGRGGVGGGVGGASASVRVRVRVNVGESENVCAVACQHWLRSHRLSLLLLKISMMLKAVAYPKPSRLKALIALAGSHWIDANDKTLILSANMRPRFCLLHKSIQSLPMLRLGGRTLNDCWLVSERSRVQTQGLQPISL